MIANEDFNCLVKNLNARAELLFEDSDVIPLGQPGFDIPFSFHQASFTLKHIKKLLRTIAWN